MGSGPATSAEPYRGIEPSGFGRALAARVRPRARAILRQSQRAGAPGSLASRMMQFAGALAVPPLAQLSMEHAVLADPAAEPVRPPIDPWLWGRSEVVGAATESDPNPWAQRRGTPSTAHRSPRRGLPLTTRRRGATLSGTETAPGAIARHLQPGGDASSPLPDPSTVTRRGRVPRPSAAPARPVAVDRPVVEQKPSALPPDLAALQRSLIRGGLLKPTEGASPSTGETDDPPPERAPSAPWSPGSTPVRSAGSATPLDRESGGHDRVVVSDARVPHGDAGSVRSSRGPGPTRPTASEPPAIDSATLSRIGAGRPRSTPTTTSIDVRDADGADGVDDVDRPTMTPTPPAASATAGRPAIGQRATPPPTTDRPAAVDQPEPSVRRRVDESGGPTGGIARPRADGAGAGRTEGWREPFEGSDAGNTATPVRDRVVRRLGEVLDRAQGVVDPRGVGQPSTRPASIDGRAQQTATIAASPDRMDSAAPLSDRGVAGSPEDGGVERTGGRRRSEPPRGDGTVARLGVRTPDSATHPTATRVHETPVGDRTPGVTRSAGDRGVSAGADDRVVGSPGVTRSAGDRGVTARAVAGVVARSDDRVVGSPGVVRSVGDRGVTAGAVAGVARSVDRGAVVDRGATAGAVAGVVGRSDDRVVGVPGAVRRVGDRGVTAAAAGVVARSDDRVVGVPGAVRRVGDSGVTAAAVADVVARSVDRAAVADRGVPESVRGYVIAGSPDRAAVADRGVWAGVVAGSPDRGAVDLPGAGRRVGDRFVAAVATDEVIAGSAGGEKSPERSPDRGVTAAEIAVVAARSAPSVPERALGSTLHHDGPALATRSNDAVRAPVAALAGDPSADTLRRSPSTDASAPRRFEAVARDAPGEPGADELRSVTRSAAPATSDRTRSLDTHVRAAVPDRGRRVGVTNRQLQRAMRERAGSAALAAPSLASATLPSVTSRSTSRSADDGMPARTGGFDAVLQRASVADAAPGREAVAPLSERFMTELGRQRATRPRRLPERFSAMSSAITGGTAARVSTDAASRRALHAVGKVAATVDDVIHFDRPIAQVRPDVVAHELTHVAHRSPAPRFFDDDRSSPEEERAEAVARLMRSGAPAILQRSPASAATTARHAPSDPGTVSAADLAARLAGSGSSGGTIQRWETGRRPGAPMIGTGRSRKSGGTGGPGVPADVVPVGSPSPVDVPTVHEAAPTASAPQAPDLAAQFDRILELLEERVITELERRGGRLRGGF